MMERNSFNDILTKTAAALDIPDHVYEDAILKYEDIGRWLRAEDSELLQYSPEIYPQGSFRLGTVVRPITGKDQYDIDLVCNLDLKKEQTTQAKLKEAVGTRLRKRDDLNKILKESRRCWTLKYLPQEITPQFHMDVLPALSNVDNPPTGILITDSELRLWQKSNPKAYAEWFYKRMEVIYLEKKANLAKSMNASIEDVPEWQVKTPLQVAIQILKRHRDIYFASLPSDQKPVSIIITTLAAHAYRGQADLYTALEEIVSVMPKYIENRDGKWWVANPVADENFADKWNEYSERRIAFLRWLVKVHEDFSNANKLQSLNEITKSLTPILGESTMVKVAKDLGLPVQQFPLLPARIVTPPVPALGNSNHVQRPTWNEQVKYKATISAAVHPWLEGKILWPLTERAVPKNVWLSFRIKTDVPTPFQIYWQVVNTGEEAHRATDLRGGFFSSTGSVHWEHTAYRGTHWVEAFIIKGSMCVARSGRKYVRIR